MVAVRKLPSMAAMVSRYQWRRIAVVAGTILLGAHGSCLAEKPDVKLDFSGYTALQGGMIVQGQYKSAKLHNRSQERLLGGFTIEATVNKRLTIAFGPECLITQAIYDNSGNIRYDADIESSHGFYFFYLNQMQGTYSFGDLDDPFLKIALGYFPFTYNQDVKSLGEYLFRATAYPGYIINDFASVYKRMPGLHINIKPVRNLNIDALLTTELQAPVGDFTPSLLLDYGIGGAENHPVVKIGAGASYSRMVPVDPSLTTPHVPENVMVINQDTIHMNPGDPATAYDSTTPGDSIYYSFSALKVMGRVSFDPLQLMGRPQIFGDDDLKLYAEACILGTQNYAVFYDSILKRIPVMVGFNVPTFKILDVLSLEVEWYNSQFSNNYEQTYFPRNKTPTPTIGSASSPEPTPYPWYWSVYARRTIVKGWQIMGEVGRNHYFMQCKYPQYQDRREQTPNHGDWQFVVRTQYSF
jgi:hypothetical protein